MQSYSVQPPGVVINHIPATERCYIGSPSIAIMPDGTYVVSHDIFGPGTTSAETLLFSSTDAGRTWRQIGQVSGQCWSGLFFHGGALYLLGTARGYASVVIRRSLDGGATWTAAEDEHSGVLFADGQYHTAPTTTVVHRGRVWRAMEDNHGAGRVGRYLRPFVMSAPVDADLLEASAWTSTNRLERDEGWFEGTFTKWSEGNIVVSPGGAVANVLRVNRAGETGEKAAIVDVDASGEVASFDAVDGFVDFPGGSKKFTIRYDEVTGRYWSLTNYVPDSASAALGVGARNTLGLISSPDLRVWSRQGVILSHPHDVDHAFQYADWVFAGDDIHLVSRTAYDDGRGGSHNYHDSNFVTFHVVPEFRKMQ